MTRGRDDPDPHNSIDNSPSALHDVLPHVSEEGRQLLVILATACVPRYGFDPADCGLRDDDEGRRAVAPDDEGRVDPHVVLRAWGIALEQDGCRLQRDELLSKARANFDALGALGLLDRLRGRVRPSTLGAQVVKLVRAEVLNAGLWEREGDAPTDPEEPGSDADGSGGDGPGTAASTSPQEPRPTTAAGVVLAELRRRGASFTGESQLGLVLRDAGLKPSNVRPAVTSLRAKGWRIETADQDAGDATGWRLVQPNSM